MASDRWQKIIYGNVGNGRADVIGQYEFPAWRNGTGFQNTLPPPTGRGRGESRQADSKSRQALRWPPARSRLTRRRRGCACRVGGSRDSCAIGRSEGWPVAGVYSPKTTSPRLSRNFMPSSSSRPARAKVRTGPIRGRSGSRFDQTAGNGTREYSALPWVDPHRSGRLETKSNVPAFPARRSKAFGFQRGLCRQLTSITAGRSVLSFGPGIPTLRETPLRRSRPSADRRGSFTDSHATPADPQSSGRFAPFCDPKRSGVGDTERPRAFRAKAWRGQLLARLEKQAQALLTGAARKRGC